MLTPFTSYLFVLRLFDSLVHMVKDLTTMICCFLHFLFLFRQFCKRKENVIMLSNKGWKSQKPSAVCWPQIWERELKFAEQSINKSTAFQKWNDKNSFVKGENSFRPAEDTGLWWSPYKALVTLRFLRGFWQLFTSQSILRNLTKTPPWYKEILGADI